MREKDGYRDVLADILAFTGGKRLLSATDVGQYLGIARQTASARYQIPREGILAPVLARKLI